MASGAFSNPVGMYGVRLEASVHVVTSSVAAVRNICHSILRAGVDVRGVVLGGLASSYAVLSEDERQMGVCLLDIGGGTTDVAVFVWQRDAPLRQRRIGRA